MNAGRALAASSHSLHYAGRPWKERAAARHFEAPWRRTLRNAVHFALLIVVLSAAMMAALVLPDPEAADAPPSPAAPLRQAIAETAQPPAPEAPLRFAIQDVQDWAPVRRPVRIFHLEAPELDHTELDYQVNARGRETRQDVLIWAPKADRPARGPNATLIIERYEAAQPTQRPFFADIARRAAQHHLAVDRMAEPADMRSKFGAIQVAESQITIEGEARACMAFRRLDTGGIVIAGWFCPPRQRVMDRVALACFLNRLDLVAAGTDRALRAIFAEAERQRGSCASARQAGRKITWLDHEAPVPPLKLSVHGR
jgi:hypothetical protein